MERTSTVPLFVAGDAQSALGISERAQAVLLHQKSKLRESRGTLVRCVRVMQWKETDVLPSKYLHKRALRCLGTFPAVCSIQKLVGLCSGHE